MRIKIAIASLFLMGSAAAFADPITIDFDDPGVPAGGYTVGDTSSGGCNFDVRGFGGTENGVDGSNNGSTHLFASDVTMTCGGTFDLLGFDIGEDFEERSFRFFLDLLFADGSSLTASARLDGDFGFQSFGIARGRADNLLSARWYSGRQFVLDDINASVPEPATLALLGLGLAGMGAARRRKQRA